MPSRWTSPGRAVVLSALLATLAAAGAYQIARPLEVSARTPLASWLFQDVHGGEGDMRWTRAHSRVLLPEPGPGLARIEVDMAAWRPRGLPGPRIVLEAGPGRLEAQPEHGRQTLAFPTVSAGWWSSDVTLHVTSETFSPGAGDTRALGVRLYAVRLIPAGPALALRRPPLQPLAWAALCGGLLCALVARRQRARARHAHAAAVLFAALLGCALIAARLHAVLMLPALGLSLLLLLLLRTGAPRAWLALHAWARAVLMSVRAGVGALGQRGTLVALVVGLAVFMLAQRQWRTLSLDPTAADGMALAHGLGAFDAQDGRRLRAVRAGAQLDLGALVAGGDRIELDVAAARPYSALTLGTWADTPVVAAVEKGWTRIAVPTHALGRSFKFSLDAEQAGLRLARVHITRQPGSPAWRPVIGALLASLLIGLLLGSVGQPRATPWGVLAMLLGSAAAVAHAPLVSLPFMTVLAALCACGWLLACLLGARGHASPADGRGADPGVHAVAALGFVAWATALLFPFYRGGHFLFHSAIAREIWQGRFLTYYLPSPDSMLARQAQWGNVVVPHPCLYHLLASPLAALPEAWFHVGEKLFLAGLLASLVVVAGHLAERLGGPRAALCAAVLVASAVPGFQLLGLGHLMTLLGCATGAWALTWLAGRLPDLAQRPVFWRSVALLTLGFLAYTATLLFLSACVAFLVATLARSEPARARALAGAWLCAATLAFGAYYVHWALPFLRDSLPHLLAGARPVVAAGTSTPSTPQAEEPKATRDLGWRLRAQPGKLDYSFGSWLVPALGLLGLLLAPRGTARDVLLAWAALLPAFIAVDLFFNLLLKHHYFTFVPLCVGAGLLLARLWTSGRLARALACALVASYVALGVQTALDVATGRIP